MWRYREAARRAATVVSIGLFLVLAAWFILSGWLF